MALDTDVIVAALRSRTGASAELVRMALRRDLVIVASVAMVLEYEAVATRAEQLLASGRSAAEILVLVDALATVAEPVRTYFNWRPQLRDADDEMVLEAAVNAGSVPIVTFNKRDFQVGAARFAIELLLPAEALQRIRI